MPAVLSALLLGLSALAAAAAPATIPITGEAIPVSASPIERFQMTGTRTRFGSLEFVGGLVVSSPSRRFGGLSGIIVQDGGRTAILVSDLGYILKAELAYQGGRLSGIAIPHLMRAPLPPSISRRDLEDIVIAPSGEVHVALERNSSQIVTFGVGENGGTTARLSALPGAQGRLGFNKGIESIDIFPTGTRHAGHMIAIGERPDKRNQSRFPCWIIDAGPCSIKVRDRFDITSARFMENGDLILLERKFTADFDVGMRLRRIAADRIEVGKALDGEILLDADLSMQIDNMEGLALHRDGAGRTILTLVSDDNLNFFQRTLILQFALIE